MRERERIETDRQTERQLLSPDSFPEYQKTQGWAGTKPRPGNAVARHQGPTYLSQHGCHRVHTSRELELGAELGFKARHQDTE